MMWLFYLVLIIHFIVAITLVLLILGQSSKGNALDGLVGATASEMFGGNASSFLKRWTKILAAAFFATSLILAFTVNRMNFVKPKTTAIEKLKGEVSKTAPAKPVANPLETQPAATPAAPAPTTTPAPVTPAQGK